MKHKKQVSASERNANRGQYLIAAAILLVGIVVSVLLLTGAIPLGQDDPVGADEEKIPVAEPSDSLQNQEDTPAEGEKASYNVRFYDWEGTLLTQCKVTQGFSPEPPQYEVEGMRFRGWDKDIFFASSDLDLYPRFSPLGEEKNIVYANAVYADNDEPICLIPRIAGTVDCCSFSIEINYDSLLLDYTGAEQLLPGITANDDAEAGVLTLSWAGDAVLTEPCALAQLYFSCTGEQCYTTTMNLVTRQIQTLKEGNTVYTESVAYDVEVHILNKE